MEKVEWVDDVTDEVDGQERAGVGVGGVHRWVGWSGREWCEWVGGMEWACGGSMGELGGVDVSREYGWVCWSGHEWAGVGVTGVA